MSSTDKRIVELEFDNKSFEAGVQTTLEALKKLDKNLDTIDGKTLKGLQDSLDNVSFKGLEAGIESLNEKFSFLGTFTRQIFSNIADDVYNASKKIVSSTIGQIMSGGSRRSLNISQAKFTFKGLLGADSIEEAMKNANDAVEGTAYGLDEAAIAASQLAASGVKLGDDMTEALQSISGVASMTGSNFSDISRIFTTVAGNGRLMGMQLTQLGQRGLNAAAIMAEQFGVTEAAFRDMVSDKDTIITFEQFYKGMHKFWEQAASANELYTGALSNFKSALGRIGQPVYDVYYNSARDALNAVRPVLNQFKTSISDTYGDLETMFGKVVEKIVNTLSIFDEKGDLKEAYQDDFENIGKIVNNLLNTFYMFGEGVAKIFKQVGEGFKRVFPESILEILANITEKIRVLAYHFRESDSLFEGVGNAAEGFFSIIRFGIDILRNLWDVIGPIFNGILVPVSKWVMNVGLTIVSEIVKKISAVTQAFKNFTGAKVFGKSIGNILSDAKTAIEKFTVVSVEKIKWFFSVLDDLPEWFKRTWESIKGFASAQFEKVIEFFGNLGINLRTVKNEVSDSTFLQNLKTLFNRFKEFLSSIKGSDILNGIGQAFIFLKNLVVEAYHAIKPVIDKIIEALKPFFASIKESLVGSFTGEAGERMLSGGILATFIYMIKKISDIVKKSPLKAFKDSIINVMGKLGNVLDAYQKNINAETIWTIAKAIGIMALSIFSLAMIDTEKVVQVAGVIAMLGLTLSAVFKMINGGSTKTKAVKAVTELQKIADGIKGFLTTLGSALAKAIRIDSIALALDMFAFAVLQLSAAIAIIAMVDPNKLWGALGVVGLMIAVISGGFAVIAKYAETINGAQVTRLAGIALSFGLFANTMATALLILSGAVSLMAVTYTSNKTGFTMGMIAIVGFMTTIVYAFKMMDQLKSSVARMVGMAASFIAFTSSLIVIGVGIAAIAGGLALMAALDPTKIMTSIFTITAILAELVVAAKTVGDNYASFIALSVSVGIFATSMAIFAGVIAVMGLIPWTSLAKFGALFVGTVATLVGAIALLSKVAKSMEKSKAGVSNFAKLVMSFGLAVALFGVGVAALVTAIGLLATMAPVIALAATVAAKGLIAFISALADGSDQLGAALRKILESLLKNLLEGIKNLFTDILPIVGESIVAALDGLVQYVPAIVEKLSTLIVTALNKLAEKIPDLVDAVFNVLGAVLEAVGNKMSGFGAIDVIALVGLATGLTVFFKMMARLRKDLVDVIPVAITMGIVLAALVAAFVVMDALDIYKTLATAASFTTVIVAVGGMVALLSKLRVNIAAAVEAAVAIGAAFDIIVVIVGGLVALLGAFASDFPEIKPILEQGVEIMGLIGKAIGEFVGSLVGALVDTTLEGVSRGVAKLGQGLADFWNNASVFFKGIENLPPGVVDSAKTIATTLLILTGAEFLDAVAKFLGGDFTQLGTQLESLADGMVAFNNKFAGFDSDKLGNMKTAAKAAELLSKAVAFVPRSGGLIDKFAGSQDFEGFGTGVEKFGEALVAFSESISGLKTENLEAMESAAEVGKAFAEMVDAIPPSGGLWQKLTGWHDMPHLNDDIGSFLDALKGFAKKAMEVPVENLERLSKVAEVGQIMADFLEDLSHIYAFFQRDESSPGVVTDTWATMFGADIEGLVESLKKMQTSIAGIGDDEQFTKDIQTVIDVCTAIANMAEHIGINAGLKAIFGGYADIGVFASQLTQLGPSISSFMKEMRVLNEWGGLNPELADKAVEVLSKFSELPGLIPHKDRNFSDNLLSFATGIIVDSDAVTFSSTLSTLGSGLKKFSDNIEGINWDNITNASENISAFLESLKGMDDKILDISTNFGEAIKNMAQAGLDQIEAGFISSYPDVTNAVKQMFEHLAADILVYVSSFEEKGQEYGGKFSLGLKEGFAANTSMILAAAAQFFTKFTTQFFAKMGEYGKESIVRFAKGMTNNFNLVSSSIKSLIQALELTFPALVERWRMAGVNSAKGYVAGLEIMKGTVISKAREMAKSAYVAAEQELVVESPSKKFTYLGEMSDVGFANGLDKYTYLVHNAGGRIGRSLLDIVKKSVEESADAISGFDINPTITPIIDYSEIQNGIGSIGGMFRNSGFSLGATSLKLSRGIDYTQAGINAYSTYDDSNILGSISDLSDQLEMLGERIAGMQVVLDSGALVGGTAPAMNNEFGRMSIMVDRGVM